MKKCLSLVLMGLVVIIFAEHSFSEDFDFRKTRWGMTVAEVKSSEPLTVAEEGKNYLGYKTQVIGKNVLVIYIFADNQLVRSKYMLAESHTNKNDFITDYDDFKEILQKKYGKPSLDKIFWKNDLYKDDHSDWGIAISLGHLIHLSKWETQDTEIIDILTGENYKITCGVEYASKNLKSIEKKEKEKKALNDF